MNLELSEEQTAVRRLARDFVEREIAPHVIAWDRAEEVDRAVVKKLGEVGFLGLTVDEEYGGSGGDHLAYCLVTEELGRGDSSVRGIVSVSLGLVAKTIAAWGDEAQKRRWLPGLTAGNHVGCFGLTEPGTGSDAGNLTTRAVRDGDDYVISGTKMFITNGTWADVVLLFARSTDAPGHKGVSAFLVPTDTPGLTRRAIHGKLGLRGQATAELVLEEVRVPASTMLGPEGKGFTVAMSALAKGRMSVAALLRRHRPGRTGRRDPLRHRARAVRQVHRPPPARPGTHHRHRGRRRRRPAPDLARRRSRRPGAALRHRGQQGQALRLRGRRPCREQRPPGLRRLRLHRRVSGRKAPARRPRDDPLRGHQPDTEAAHRAGADGGFGVLSRMRVGLSTWGPPTEYSNGCGPAHSCRTMSP